RGELPPFERGEKALQVLKVGEHLTISGVIGIEGPSPVYISPIISRRETRDPVTAGQRLYPVSFAKLRSRVCIFPVHMDAVLGAQIIAEFAVDDWLIGITRPRLEHAVVE